MKKGFRTIVKMLVLYMSMTVVISTTGCDFMKYEDSVAVCSEYPDSEYTYGND